MTDLIPDSTGPDPTGESDPRRATRRKFLIGCGKFAAVTPPAISLLLSSTEQSFATAASGGGHGGHHGGGYGGWYGKPGKYEKPKHRGARAYKNHDRHGDGPRYAGRWDRD